MKVKKDYHMAVISSIICGHIGNNIKYKIIAISKYYII